MKSFIIERKRGRLKFICDESTSSCFRPVVADRPDIRLSGGLQGAVKFPWMVILRKDLQWTEGGLVVLWQPNEETSSSSSVSSNFQSMELQFQHDSVCCSGNRCGESAKRPHYMMPVVSSFFPVFCLKWKIRKDFCRRRGDALRIPLGGRTLKHYAFGDAGKRSIVPRWPDEFMENRWLLAIAHLFSLKKQTSAQAVAVFCAHHEIN